MEGLVLTAIVLVVAGCYAVTCWLWPYRACGRCSGTGKRPALFFGSAFGLCRRCKGSGRRLRLGRWAYNHAKHLSDAGRVR